MAEFIAQEEMDRGQAPAVPDRVVGSGYITGIDENKLHETGHEHYPG